MKKHEANTGTAVSTKTLIETPKGFPTGLKLMEAPSPTGTHDIAWGNIEYGKKEVRVNLIKAFNAPEGGEYLPTAVFVGQKKVWSFDWEKKAGFRGRAFIRQIIGEVIIILLDFNEKIVKVVPLYDLASRVEIRHKGAIKILGERSADKLFDLKMAAHKEFKLRYHLTDEEVEIRDARIAASKAENDKKKSAAEAERKARLENILKRPEVVVFTEKYKLFGVPVTAGEWEMLPNGTKVVLVEAYDNNLGKPVGEPLEAFFVKKGGGMKPKKEKLFSGLSWKRPKPKEEEPIEAIDFISVDMGNGSKEIALFTEAGLQELRKRGLNNGTIVAVEDYTAEETVKVVSLNFNTIETIGCFPRIQR